MLVLRDYQNELAERLEASLSDGGTPMLQLVTGGGKTEIAIELAHRFRKLGAQIVFAAHRTELIDQTTLRFINSGLDAFGAKSGVWKPGQPLPKNEVVVVNPGLLTRRAPNFKRSDVVYSRRSAPCPL